MTNPFEHRSQDERLASSEQIARACSVGTTKVEEEEADFSIIFQPPNRAPQND